MFLTHDILVAKGACSQGIDFFDKCFPNGAELEKVITMRHIPAEFLHWGFNFLDATDHEKELYIEALKISNSSNVTHSDHVLNSTYINHSSYVENSHYIFYSDEIKNSQEVVSSHTVENSFGVFNSNLVYDSNKIAYSTNVNDSENIANSEYVMSSKSIIQSNLITNSQALRKCTNITDCVFCVDCSNIKHALFCTHQASGEFLLFNHPIEEVHYYNIFKMYLKVVSVDLNLMSTWEPEFLIPQTPSINYDMRKHYSTLPQKFMKWVKTLPNYNPNILYQITYLPEFIK